MKNLEKLLDDKNCLMRLGDDDPIILKNVSGQTLQNLIDVLCDKDIKTLPPIELQSLNSNKQNISKLAKAIKKSHNLTSLDLSCSTILNSGAKKIAEAIKVNQSLKTLKLAACFIQIQGGRRLAHALLVNTSLTMLNITGNEINPKEMNKINCQLAVNKAIQAQPAVEARNLFLTLALLRSADKVSLPNEMIMSIMLSLFAIHTNNNEVTMTSMFQSFHKSRSLHSDYYLHRENAIKKLKSIQEEATPNPICNEVLNVKL